MFSDAGLANMSDKTGSMGAHLVFLVDEKKRCCPLAWQANKVKRVVKSTLAAETLSLAEGLENGIYLRKIMSEIIGEEARCIPIIGYVENKSVTQSLYSTKMVDDKYLRLDLASIRQMIETGEVHSVKWCSGDVQLANSLTKRSASPYLLQKTLQTGMLNVAGIDV